jgi:hypothetical protein
MRNLRIGKWTAHGALYALVALSLTGCNEESSSAATPPTPPAPMVGAATLEWRAPDTYTDGSPLTNLAGYRIYYGTDVAQMQNKIDVTNPGVLTYVVEGLPPNTYYFAVTAVTAAGHESERSNAGRKIIT